MTRTGKRPSNYWISGFRLAQARRVAEFFFGDFFISCNKNDKKGVFEIRIHESLKVITRETEEVKVEKIVTPEEYVPIDYFKRYWGPQWVIIMISEKDVDKI